MTWEIHGHHKVRFNQFPLEVLTSLVAPSPVDLETSLLAPYVKRLLLPRELDVLLLDPDYLHGLNIKLGGVNYILDQNRSNGPPAWYLSVGHHDDQDVLVEINKQFGLELKRAVIIPSRGKVSYTTFIHELLHATFDNLSNDNKRELVEAAEASYPSVHELLLRTPLNQTEFNWPEDIRAQARARRAAGKRIDGLDILSNLPLGERERCVDECIAYSFTYHPAFNDFPIGLGRGPFLAPATEIEEPMRSVMKRLGYNLEDPPLLVHPLLPREE